MGSFTEGPIVVHNIESRVGTNKKVHLRYMILDCNYIDHTCMLTFSLSPSILVDDVRTSSDAASKYSET